MENIEKLIEFLQEKGFQVNGISPFENISNVDTLTNNLAIHKLNNRQIEFNAIMHELYTIYKIVKSDTNYHKSLKSYFEMHIHKIDNKEAIFDIHHPLFGYKPFADFLMVHYIEHEQYEKCIEIKSRTYHESYIS